MILRIILILYSEWESNSQCMLQNGFFYTEAATEGVLYTKVFLNISENSQKNTCARVSF